MGEPGISKYRLAFFHIFLYHDAHIMLIVIEVDICVLLELLDAVVGQWGSSTAGPARARRRG